jgi:hypothetical protein
LLDTLHRSSEEPYWKLRQKGGCYDIFFITNFNGIAKLKDTMNDIIDKYGYSGMEMGTYVQPIVQGVNYHCEFNLFFDKNNTSEKNKIRTLSEAAVNALMNQGAFFSRPYGEWTDLAYRRDAQTTIALRKIKQIFDPNNIMNPGKLCF